MPPVAICVPVRDEAERLPRLFDAIDALDHCAGQRVHLCVWLDGCSDGSAAAVARYRSRGSVPVTVGEACSGPPNAGIARHRAMTLGLTALGEEDGVLLTTDADSWPQGDWLTAMIAGLDQADLVAGRVLRDRRDSCLTQDRIDRYYDALAALRRQIDPVAWQAPVAHHQTSGANMGLRAQTYRALGGFAPIPNGEDARLADDAARAGWRVRRDAAAVVFTSDRRHGRATGGLAETLRELDRDGASGVSVAHPDDAIWQYRMQALARRAFTADQLAAFAPTIGLTPDHLRGVARECPNAEAFAMRVVPAPPTGMRHVPLPLAEAALTAMLAPPAEALPA